MGEFEVHSGYVPGTIGRVVELHAAYYSQYWGLGRSFEIEMAQALAEFFQRFDPQRDGFWVAIANGKIVGSVAIDGKDAASAGARVRWFLLSPAWQGRGMGHTLLKTAIGFCQQAGYAKVYLWTFEGLTAARHLYEKFGFVLVDAHAYSGWDRPVTHQKFECRLESDP